MSPENLSIDGPFYQVRNLCEVLYIILDEELISQCIAVQEAKLELLTKRREERVQLT
jgi:hypothetical protein